MIVFDNIISDAKIVKKYENDDFFAQKNPAGILAPSDFEKISVR